MHKISTSNNSDYLSIVENSPDFITRYDSDLRYLYINRTGLQAVGSERGYIIGKTHRESGIYKSQQCDFMEEKIRNVFETGNQFNDQFEWETNGGFIWLHLLLTAEYDINGKITSVLGFSRDITKYKLAEKAFYESEEIFDHFMEHSPIYVFFKDSEIRSLRLSKNYERMLGRSVEDLLGKTMDELFPSDLAKKMIADDKRILKKGRLKIIDEELNGRYYTTIKFPIIISGTPKYLAGYTIDVTDQKKAELRLQASNTELEISKAKTSGLLEDLREEMGQRGKVEEQISKLNTELEQRVLERTKQLETANNELEAFAFSVSHDLRAPLRAIAGFSRYLLEDYGSKFDQDGKKLLDLIRGNTQKMDQLITDILALSRVSRSEHKASRIEMTKMVISMLNETVADEKLREIKVCIDELPDAVADPTYMKQVWINLISNAVKFSSKKKNPEISIRGFLKDGFNIYSISDNGVGFNSEYKNKLFGVFQRLHKSDEFEGTGVGLAIVQRIIHRHGGEVWANGEEGQGATFYFSLPVNDL